MLADFPLGYWPRLAVSLSGWMRPVLKKKSKTISVIILFGFCGRIKMFLMGSVKYVKTSCTLRVILMWLLEN